MDNYREHANNCVSLWSQFASSSVDVDKVRNLIPQVDKFNAILVPSVLVLLDHKLQGRCRCVMSSDLRNWLLAACDL